MPVTIAKVKGGYRVSTPNGVHAKHTSKKNAEKQRNLLNAVEHGWKPTKKKKKKHIMKHISDTMSKIHHGRG